ncbi:MAG: choice-of-anchor tandem repeat GloVer-containing protein [Syntrophobacteraceae bacterium]
MGNTTVVGSALYGTTQLGGTADYGTIFKINENGTGYQILHSFAGHADDGAYPSGSLTLVGSTLYGTTTSGFSQGDGVAFKIKTDGSGYGVIHGFMGDWGGSDGSTPCGSLTLSGNTLYGMTKSGGNDGVVGSGSYGTIFKINTDGSGYGILYRFWGGASDGALPRGSLTIAGNTLYGMTTAGGVGAPAAGGNGTIFKINTDGNGYQVLHFFQGGASDGANPYGSLTLMGSYLYGMASYGPVVGSSATSGMIFRIDTDGNGYQVLYNFADSGNGGGAYGDLSYVNPKLYGMTAGGGHGCGVIFEINPDGTGFQVLYKFNCGTGDASAPQASLTRSGLTFYATTQGGGANSLGTVFSLNGWIKDPMPPALNLLLLD